MILKVYFYCQRRRARDITTSTWSKKVGSSSSNYRTW